MERGFKMNKINLGNNTGTTNPEPKKDKGLKINQIHNKIVSSNSEFSNTTKENKSVATDEYRTHYKLSLYNRRRKRGGSSARAAFFACCSIIMLLSTVLVVTILVYKIKPGKAEYDEISAARGSTSLTCKRCQYLEVINGTGVNDQLDGVLNSIGDEDSNNTCAVLGASEREEVCEFNIKSCVSGWYEGRGILNTVPFKVHMYTRGCTYVITNRDYTSFCNGGDKKNVKINDHVYGWERLTPLYEAGSRDMTVTHYHCLCSSNGCNDKKIFALN